MRHECRRYPTPLVTLIAGDPRRLGCNGRCNPTCRAAAARGHLRARCTALPARSTLAACCAGDRSGRAEHVARDMCRLLVGDNQGLVQDVVGELPGVV
eukprot:5601520-Prymnesium_polylepis.1